MIGGENGFDLVWWIFYEKYRLRWSWAVNLPSEDMKNQTKLNLVFLLLILLNPPTCTAL
jgi:hypothetical protein